MPIWTLRWTHHEPYPQHDHDFLELALVMGGSCHQHSVLGRYPLRAGDAVLLRPGTWHAYESTRSLDVWICCFGVHLLRHELLWTRQDPRLAPLLWGVSPGHDQRGVTILQIPPSDRQELDRTFAQLFELRVESPSQFAAEKIGLLLQALGVVARHAPAPERESAPPQVVLTAAEALQGDPSRDWSLEDLVALTHIDKSYLCRLFQSSLGVSPMAYLTRLRAELAATLVRNTDRPLKEIGQHVGWPEPAHFARNFRKHFGISARTYRDRFRSSRPAPQLP